MVRDRTLDWNVGGTEIEMLKQEFPSWLSRNESD